VGPSLSWYPQSSRGFGTVMRALEDGCCPDLRSLDLFLSGFTDDDTVRFARAVR